MVYTELFAILGIYAVFDYMTKGPAYVEEKRKAVEWDQIPVSADQIDHDLSLYAGPGYDSTHPDNIGDLRAMQEQRNTARAMVARPMLDQFYITRDNNKKLELIIE